MKQRELQVGKKDFALVDEFDFAKLSLFSWRLRTHKGKACKYAITSLPRFFGGKTVSMHSLVLRWLANKNQPSSKAKEIDHINGNGLDNRRSNLRFATSSENKYNRGKPNRGIHSRYKGVSWHIPSKKWCMQVSTKKGKIMKLFVSEIDAAKAYDKAATQYYKQFARLNFPRKVLDE